MAVLGGTLRGTTQLNTSNVGIQGNAPLFTRRLSLHVGGDMAVGLGAVVHVDECGWRYGAGRMLVGSTWYTVAAHGGVSGLGSQGHSATNTYGSVFAPVLPGSSGGTDNNRMGGGIIRLDIGGNLVVDGLVSSKGQGSKWGPGTGGSILIHARSVTGSGVISANGGAGILPPPSTDADGGGGGGGRVAVYTDEPIALPASSIVALGGYYQSGNTGNNARRAGLCGTVYLALKSAPNAGLLRLNNDDIDAEGRRAILPGAIVHFDSENVAYGTATLTPQEDFEKVDLLLERRGNAQLSRDASFNSLRFGASAGNEIEFTLAGNTLTVRDFYPKGSTSRIGAGTYVKLAGVHHPKLAGIPDADAGIVVVLPNNKSTLFFLR